MAVEYEQEQLWGLLNELSKQLSANRLQCEALQRQAEQLKVQAVHNGTGFILRRFNVDVSQETFESELERLNATLVLENQSLQHENKQLSMLLKDYEATLETVMARFRTFAHCSQQHDLQLTKHYEDLLDQLPAQAAFPEQAILNDPAQVEASLHRLSALLRKAYRAMANEDPSPPTSPSADKEHGSQFGVAPSDDDNAKLGGYLTLLGTGASAMDDEAMERDIEVAQLRQENEHLKQLLALSEAGQQESA